MENASRALAIAGGMLLAILVIGLVIFGWGRITEYRSEIQASKLLEDQAKFNEELESYNRVIRGYDLISLCNKIDDLNAVMSEKERYADENSIPMKDGRYTDTNFKKIIVLVQMSKNGRLPGDGTYTTATNDQIGIIARSQIQNRYSISEKENTIVTSALSGWTTKNYKIYDLSKYIRYLNGDYKGTVDFGSLKNDKKMINDLYFVCKTVLYDTQNGRIFMLVFKNIDKNGEEINN